MNKQELLNELNEIKGSHNSASIFGNGAIYGVTIAMQLIEQLDEPEKVVVPEFAADWIEKYREREANVWHLLNNVSVRKGCELEFWSWLWGENNVDVLARAWLYGYTVEGWQKYRVLDGNTTLLGRINGLILTTVEILEYYPEYAPTFDLTEQEIKDYDPRYMTFAKPVEELKE